MALIYTFRGTLCLTGALHIGSGGEGDDTDATVIRDSRGNPYIPGSSLRGAFRAAVERLAKPLLKLDPSHLEDEPFQKNLKIEIDRARNEQHVQAVLNQKLNPLDRLFGTTYWASPLIIPDLPLIKEDKEAREVRHGVGIDRDTGVARDAIKYDFEVLPRGLSFNFLMRCEMPVGEKQKEIRQAWERALAIGLRLMEQGELALGGRLARGVGQVQLEKLDVFILDQSNPTALKAALLSDSLEGQFGIKQAAGWTRRMLQAIEGA